MIDPSRELFKWGPIDAKIIYVDAFMQAMPRHIGLMSGGWPDILLHVKNDKVIAIADYANLRNNGEKLFIEYVMDREKLDKHYKDWKELAEKMLSLEEMINPDSLKKLDDGKLKDLFKFWYSEYMEFWVTGFLPELANWGGEQLLKRKIMEMDEKNFVMLFERLAAPEDLSFHQKEELDLLQAKVAGKGLEEHQKRYYWIKNSYGNVERAGLSFFEKRLDGVSGEEAAKMIENIAKLPEKTREEKEKLVKEHKLSDEIHEISGKLSFCIWWQDLRKKYIFIANHFTKILLEEISRRKGIPVDALEEHAFPEIVELLETGKGIDKYERSVGFLEYFHEGRDIEYFHGEKADGLIRRYTEVKVDADIEEIKGMVVSRGTARGKVRILLTPKDIDKLEEGEVLVAPMTSPDYTIAMRKASAIITDEGGMTCHAAIVSRELGKPCIVATRIATKALKDGDLVEVDAENGIIKKLG